MRVIFEHDRAAVIHGDSARLGELLAENSVDAAVFDPPAGVAFMGKEWDKDKGGRDAWVAWLRDLLAPVYRAMKPGAYGLSWALPRTSHWTATAIEDAGFEIRDVHHDALASEPLFAQLVESLDDEQRGALERALAALGEPILYQVFGQGFPKSLDLSKAIDAMHAGANQKEQPPNREILDEILNRAPERTTLNRYAGATVVSAPVTSDAQRAVGVGTALKPAVEHWILFRKPLDGTYAENFLAHGTGGLNIDACRIGAEVVTQRQKDMSAYHGDNLGAGISTHMTGVTTTTVGRWPAHLSLQHHPDCRVVGESVEEREKMRRTDTIVAATSMSGVSTGATGTGEMFMTTTTRYECAPSCPARALDEQSGMKTGTHGIRAGQPRGDNAVFGKAPKSLAVERDVAPSKGGASRFFYCPKPPRSEKDAGLGHLAPKTAGEATDREDGTDGLRSPRAGAGRTGGARNSHPTVKSVELMRWLVRLVTPPGGIVLDPFAGSGTTGVAALAEGRNFIGCELTEEYLPILVGRIRYALGLPPE